MHAPTTTRPRLAALAALVVVGLTAAACGDDDGDTADPGPAPSEASEASEASADAGTATSAGADTSADATAGGGGPVIYAYEQEMRSYNNNTSAENAQANTVALNQVLPNVFMFTDDAGVDLNTELMVSAEVTSESPQIVEYVVAPNAVWSDGEPIDCDDFVLHWVALNGEYKATAADGTVATDPETGAELPLFDGAGTTGWDQVASTECSPDGKTITQTFTSPYPDWQGLYIGFQPAHIVEQQAGVPDLVAAVEADDEAALAAVAEFWNTGWVLNPGEIPADLTPSGGPFSLGTWEAGSSLTLVRNEQYWGTAPAADEVIIRFIPQDGQAQALANREIQAMDPQPNPELVAQIEGIADVDVTTTEQFSYEHLDFNFNTPAFQDPVVREAFALCVPRQAIVDRLIKSQNPEAIVANNRWIYTFEDTYVDTSGGRFLEPDIDQSRQLLDQAGQQGMTVRIGYRTPNQRRTDTVALIKASCDQAGFVVEDTGSESFFGVELNQGDFDVALYAWTGTPLKTGSSSTYITGGGNNNGNYSNPATDALITELNSTLDQDHVVELANEIDAILWDDLATLPLFTFPAILAVAEGAGGVRYNPTQYGLTWNAQEWSSAT